MDNNTQKNSINTNIFTREFGFSPVNPFNAKNINQVSFTQNPQKRLNGYDSTILNNSKFDETEEQELSIDYRIKEKEQSIKDLDEKIKLADNYGTQNEALGLKAKRQRYLQELSTLEKQRAYGGRVLGDKEKILHETLKEKMTIHPSCVGLRVLGNGELKGAVTVKACYVTPSAKEKIEKAGGKVELV